MLYAKTADTHKTSSQEAQAAAAEVKTADLVKEQGDMGMLVAQWQAVLTLAHKVDTRHAIK